MRTACSSHIGASQVLAWVTTSGADTRKSHSFVDGLPHHRHLGGLRLPRLQAIAVTSPIFTASQGI
jgi:hypothetical protein